MDGHGYGGYFRAERYKSRKEICVDTMVQYHLDFWGLGCEFLKSGFEVEKDDPKTLVRLEFHH